MNGYGKIQWAERNMKVLSRIRERFEDEKPLEGIKVGMALHVEAKTAVLVKTLIAGGAEVAITGCNPLSTQDDVAEALRKDGIRCFAKRGMCKEEYYNALNEVIDFEPDIVIDDGADLISLLHHERRDKADRIMGATEETTTGVIRLRAMERDGVLKFPVIAVNDAYTKYLFDNRYGTGQSTIDGILRSTSVLLAGKNFVVCGYGWCGRGLAMRARGMGANVIVTEVDPVKALEAVMDGFRVMPIAEAAKIGDILVTVTGNKHVIGKEAIDNIKDGAIIANSGHFDVEIDIPYLESVSTEWREIRPNVKEYHLINGKKVYLLADGRLVNLAAAEGHPSEVMDMSFSNQALVAEWLLNNAKKLEKKVYSVPYEIDRKVAELKLETMGIKIDVLTDEQKRYLSEWREGT